MLRLGVLTPSSNTVLEPVTMRLVAPMAASLSLHFARFLVTEISDEAASHEQFAGAAMIDAARLLADARVDAILWAGTSGAWEGLDADRTLVARIREATGVESTTATLALLEAMRALEVKRYGLVVPYVEPIVAAIVRNLAGEGFECVASSSDSITRNWDFAAVDAATIVARVREVGRARPDAVVVHCTNLRGAEIAETTETELGLPVLDSVVVGLWGALRLLGLETPATGFGRLSRMSTTAALAPP